MEVVSQLFKRLAKERNKRAIKAGYDLNEIGDSEIYTRIEQANQLSVIGQSSSNGDNVGAVTATPESDSAQFKIHR